MAETEYNKIYTVLREKMEDGTYAFQKPLPSENTLVRELGCSRNIIRRVIGQLASEEYVQSIHGKGVRIIYQPRQQQSEFILGGVESLKEAVARSRKSCATEMVCFMELTVDKTIRRRTTFPMGVQIYYVQRARCIEGEVLIIDHNYFLKDVVRDLTPEIAERSIYEYMENNLGESAVTTGRKVTVGCANQIDEKYLGLRDYSCTVVVSSMTYNKKGVMFEFTQSRHRPNQFVFYDLVHRARQVD